jgi:SAM-dependent methyltransferase
LTALYVTVRHALHPAAVRFRRLRRPFVLHALGRTTPLSPHFGVERGTPLDRHYIDRFVSDHAGDIKGRALEFQSNRYLAEHGRAVDTFDIVDRFGAEGATIVTDLATDTLIPSASYDCAIVTQVLHYVYDVQAAVRNLHRVLKPGGVLLATVLPSAASWSTSSRAAGRGTTTTGGSPRVPAPGSSATSSGRAPPRFTATATS